MFDKRIETSTKVFKLDSVSAHGDNLCSTLTEKSLAHIQYRFRLVTYSLGPFYRGCGYFNRVTPVYGGWIA